MNFGGSSLPWATPRIRAHAQLGAVLALEHLELDAPPSAISSAHAARSVGVTTLAGSLTRSRARQVACGADLAQPHALARGAPRWRPSGSSTASDSTHLVALLLQVLVEAIGAEDARPPRWPAPARARAAPSAGMNTATLVGAEIARPPHRGRGGAAQGSASPRLSSGRGPPPAPAPAGIAPAGVERARPGPPCPRTSRLSSTRREQAAERLGRARRARGRARAQRRTAPAPARRPARPIGLRVSRASFMPRHPALGVSATVAEGSPRAGSWRRARRWFRSGRAR